jgi:predicted transcriptional regulator
MSRRKSRSFTEVELEFMRVLWERCEAAPDDIAGALLAEGRLLSGGSIRNVLAIMREKGYVSRRKEGKAFLYRARVQKEEARTGMVRDLLNQAFAGSESLLVASLLDTGDIRQDELEKIERLIAERKERERS